MKQWYALYVSLYSYDKDAKALLKITYIVESSANRRQAII